METENYEYPFLDEVYTPPSQPKIDFVFVHGLNPRGRNDHPFETWRHQNGTFWPRDYLPQDIPHARVFVYGYNSNVIVQVMSTANINDHANLLLNLLDMEQSPQMNTRQPKIIFIGHNLGGLVIKQALLNAHEDPKYRAIRMATCGLVFFGTPHRGLKTVKVAAKLARLVSSGHVNVELLNCLEYNSEFMRQMSSRFSHQLEDYQVVSFVEGKEVLLAGAGPASVSHLVVDEESAVLGLPGNRETRLKLDADHSQMCKVGSRGPMYKLIMGNIKQIADQVLVAEGYIPQSTWSHPAPLLPTNSSPLCHTAVVGTMYVAADSDPRSIQAAKHKNHARWDQARILEYAVFQEHLRTLGPDHHTTLAVGYHLAEVDFQSAYLSKATEWCEWVSRQSQRTLGTGHPLTMKAESLMGEILCARGRYQEAESVCTNVLARQQVTVGEDDLDTLETRRRLSATYGHLGQESLAVSLAERRTEALQRVLGANHIRVLASVLDSVEVMITARTLAGDNLLTVRGGEAQRTQMTQLARRLLDLLGLRHPLCIRALRLQGTLQMLERSVTEAEETLRRALAIAEETLGPEHPESMGLVAAIGTMYLHHTPGSHGNQPEASPWLARYLRWAETRKGTDSRDVQTMLSTLARLHMERQQYAEASRYYERLVESYTAADMTVPQTVQTDMQRTHAMLQYSPVSTFVRKRF